MFYVDITCVIFPFTVLILTHSRNCDAITNTSLNASDHYKVIDDSNVTHVKTLQKEDKGKITYFSPVNNPVRFKEIPDSALSSTSDSHSRGLPFHEHQGYGLSDYEESPHYGYDHDYHFQDPHLSHHKPHTYEHHDYEHHHYPGYHSYGHGHYKYDKHALATKAALWPLAGIALLGAAALAVSSPILVQLGVVSGKRRRRATAEIIEPDFAEYSLKKYTENIEKPNTETKFNTDKSNYDNIKRKSTKPDILHVEQPHNEKFKRKVVLSNNGRLKRSKILGHHHSTIKSHIIDQSTKSPWQYDKSHEDDRFIPIPIKLRSAVEYKPYE